MKKLLLFLLLTPLAYSQTWFKVANGGDTVTASQGMTFRYGMGVSTYAIDTGGHLAGSASAAAWSPSVTLTADGVVAYSLFGNDPDFGVSKEVDILETSVAQTVTVTPAGSTTALTVSVPAIPVTTNPCSADNTTCTMGTNSDSAQIITTSGNTSLNPTETATLKAAIQAVQQAHLAVQAAETNLQTVQKQIATNHNAVAPYQITTDFSTTIEEVPPVTVTTAQ